MDDINIPANTPTEETPGYSYDEIHNADTRQVATETPVVEPKVETKEEPKVEEPKVEVKVEEPKVEEKEIDPAILAKEIADKLKEELTPAQETKSPAQLYLEKAKAEGKTPTWEDALNFVAEHGSKQALETLRSEQAAAIKTEQDRQEAQKLEESRREEQNKKVLDDYNKTIDIQLQELIDDGKLSPIKDSNNPNDPGVIERKALFQTMLDVNQDRLSKGKPAVSSIKEVYAFHYQRPNTRPPGEDAPISMGKGNNNANSEEPELDYMKDVAKPWSFFKRGR